MSHIDVPTLLAVLRPLSVLSALAMLAIWHNNRQFPGTAWWAAAAVAVLPAPFATPALASAMVPVLAPLAALLALEGVQRFRAAQPGWQLLALPLLATATAALAARRIDAALLLPCILCVAAAPCCASIACNLRTRDVGSGLAREDVLTGLPNRRHVNEQLAQFVAQAARTGLGFGVIILDLNHFKQVNDRHGHHAGDALLREMAQRLLTFRRGTDFVGRLGGDQFIALIHGITSDSQLERAVARMRATVNGPLRLQGGIYPIHASIGAARLPGDSLDPEQLLQLADRRMYQDKARGRNAQEPAMPGEPRCAM